MLNNFQLCETHRWRVKRYRTLRFVPGLNLLIGPNGTGKSTILRTIANCSKCQRNEDGPTASQDGPASGILPEQCPPTSRAL